MINAEWSTRRSSTNMLPVTFHVYLNSKTNHSARSFHMYLQGRGRAKMFLRVNLKGYRGLLRVTIDELCQPHTTKADFRIRGRHNHIIRIEATCCSLSEWKENNWCQFKIFTHTTYGTRETQQKATGIFCFPNRDPRETWLYSVFKFNVDPMSINLVFNGWKWNLKGFPDENY